MPARNVRKRPQGVGEVPGLDSVGGVVLEGVFLDVGFVDEGVEQDAQDLDGDDGHERRQGDDTEAAHIAIILRIVVFCVLVRLALFCIKTHHTHARTHAHTHTRTHTHNSHEWLD